MNYKDVIKTLAILSISTIGGAGATFITQALIARNVGPTEFGNFISALNLTIMLTPLATIGVSQYWLKSFGSDRDKAFLEIKLSLILTVISSLIAIFIMLSWAFFGPNTYQDTTIIIALSICIISNATTELLSSRHQVLSNNLGLATVTAAQASIRLVLIIIVLIFWAEHVSILIFALLYSITGVLLSVIYGIKLYKFIPINQKAEKFIPDWINILKQSYPFSIAGVFVYIYMQSDIIMLKYLSTSEDAGIYGLAYSIITASFLIPIIIFNRYLYPKIHILYNTNKQELKKLYTISNIAMFIFGTTALILIYLCAEPFVKNIFGENYAKTIDLLYILSVGVPIYFICCSAGSILNTGEHIKKKVVYMGIIATLNVLLNFIFIPRYGAQGAAYTTVFTYILMLYLYTRKANKILNLLNR